MAVVISIVSVQRPGPILILQELCFVTPEVCSAAKWTRRSTGIAQEDGGEKGAEGALEDQ